ncbi:hypothetical protein LXL04_011055 [Taraxacum kok-saghyz]
MLKEYNRCIMSLFKFYKMKEGNEQEQEKFMKIDLNSLPVDLAERKPMEFYHVNQRYEIRRAPLQKGHFQPKGHEFPIRDFGVPDPPPVFRIFDLFSLLTFFFTRCFTASSPLRPPRFAASPTQIRPAHPSATPIIPFSVAASLPICSKDFCRLHPLSNRFPVPQSPVSSSKHRNSRKDLRLLSKRQIKKPNRSNLLAAGSVFLFFGYLFPLSTVFFVFPVRHPAISVGLYRLQQPEKPDFDEPQQRKVGFRVTTDGGVW